MSSAAAFTRSLSVWIDRNLSASARSEAFARVARAEVARVVASGRASPLYETTVDGRRGADESTVKPDGGVIHYEFTQSGDIIARALGYLITKSPYLTGAFRREWTYSVDGVPWHGKPHDVPPRAKIHIVNPMPYTRKLLAPRGARGSAARKALIHQAALYLRPRYPDYTFNLEFVRLPSSFATAAAPEVPYVLRTNNGQWEAVRGVMRPRRRSDRARGQAITYPSLAIARG